MNDPFEQALTDLGVTDTPDFQDLYYVSLRREDGSKIHVNLFRDREDQVLRLSITGSEPLPEFITPELFERFASAALEPLRGGPGVGILDEGDGICVYQHLPMQRYKRGDSVFVLEQLLGAVEEWDSTLRAQAALVAAAAAGVAHELS